MWCKQAYVAPGRYFGKGSTPLHEAAAAGHQGIVEALVAANADLAIQDCMVSRHCGQYCVAIIKLTPKGVVFSFLS